jgi:hypothetical protein
MPLRPPAGFIRPGFDPLKNPNAPTIGTATGGDASASVSFTPPANVGGSAISAYYAVSDPDRITSSGASSPVTVTGLTNGTPYTFQVWALNTYGPGPFSAASGSVTPSLPDRGVYAGGTNGTYSNTIQFITFSTTGNSTDFGDLTQARWGLCGFGSTTRSCFAGGYTGTNVNTIDYITTATAGNATDFGDLLYSTRGVSGLSNNVNGLIIGGRAPSPVSTVNAVTIASAGNAVDFGNLSGVRTTSAGCASTTRGVVGGGENASLGLNTMVYTTIGTSGSWVSFGNLATKDAFLGAFSSSTRGVFGGGYNEDAGAVLNTIQYITIASTGNAVDFGDLTVSRYSLTANSSLTRGCFAGGTGPLTSSDPTNIIDYVTIASTGNATDFGDLLTTNTESSGTSNCHGGL